jgi:hypothetical protein
MSPAAGRKEIFARLSPPATSIMDSWGRRWRRWALDKRTRLNERFCPRSSSADPALASKPKVVK